MPRVIRFDHKFSFLLTKSQIADFVQRFLGTGSERNIREEDFKPDFGMVQKEHLRIAKGRKENKWKR